MSHSNQAARCGFARLLLPILAAFVWLMIPISMQAAIPQSERDALIAFYNSANGPNWALHSGWLGPAGSECGWYGVTCDATQSTVVQLRVGFITGSGSLPADLGKLTNLQVLSLRGVGPLVLGGSIPREIGNLKSLQTLRLAGFGGMRGSSIPAEIGNLAQLVVLDLSDDKLGGNIPAEIGNLTRLQTLDLSGNDNLSGALPPALGNLRDLTSLNLHLDQNVSGPIPAELGNLTKLQTLDLYWNSLSGSIPPALGNLTELTLLELSVNRLTGSIPPALGNLTKLQTLNLASNSLSGTIPAEFGNLTHLSDINLSINQLTGEIPNVLNGKPLNIAYNAVHTSDASLKAFLDKRTPGWDQTETVAPSSVSAQPESGSSLFVQWVPISFAAYGGRYEVWVSATSGGPYTLAGATADKLASSLRIAGLSAALTYYLVVRTVSDPNPYNQNTVTSEFSAEIRMAVAAMGLTLSAGGAATATTIGGTGLGQAGYAQVDMSSGNAFYGIAVYSYRRDGITVSECGVPASPPTTSARIFVDYRTGATIPGSSGKVTIDTGLALVNRGAGPATITYTLRNLNGQVLSLGTGSLAKDAHVARYLWELPALAPGFSIPASFPTDTGYGTLEIASDQPLSVLALRLTTNQRGEILVTSTPMADLTRPLSTTPIYFAQFMDGGGYTTTLMLMNTSSVMATGMLRIYANDGSPLAVQKVGGAGGSAFAYAIAPGGAYVLQTDAAPVNFNVGWVELIPDPGTPTPMGAGVYQSSQDGVLVAESGIAAATPTTHARVFVDTAGGHNSSVALANPGTASASVAFAALGMDGSTPAGSSVGPMTLNGKGHAAQFVWERISGLPAGFQGVLDMVSTTPFVPLTIRALVNERGNFLFTAFPVADMNQPAPSPILFPQIAAGSGFMTEFILLSAGAPGAATLHFFNDAGTPLAIGK